MFLWKNSESNSCWFWFFQQASKNLQFSRSVSDQFLDFFLENWGYVSEWVLGFLRTGVMYQNGFLDFWELWLYNLETQPENLWLSVYISDNRSTLE